MKKLRVAMIGGGAVLRHLYRPAFARVGAVELAAVVDPRPRDEVGVSANVAHFRKSFEVFFREDARGLELDAAIVALPNVLHEPCVNAALAAGLNVLCEKPLSLKPDACLAMGRAAAGANRVLAVGMARRRLASFQALKQVLDSGRLGKVLEIDIEDGAPYAWPVSTASAFSRDCGGVLADIGVHYLDQVLALFGTIRPTAYRDDSRGGVEANAELQFQAGPGIPGALRLSRTHRLENRAMIVCERGSVWTEKDAFDACVMRDDAMPSMVSRIGPSAESAAATGLPDAVADQLRAFARAVEEGRAPEVGASDAAAVAGAIDWAYGRRGEDPSGSRRPENGPVLVTGATGFIGSALVERLHEEGWGPAKLAVRQFGTCAEVARFPVDLERVDLLDPAQVRDVMRGAKFVFHLAYGRDGDGAERVTIEGTRHVIEAAIAQGAECVVVLSSIYVFGRPETHEPLDERQPYAPVGGNYGAEKRLMEEWVLSRAASSGKTRLVVLNPSCVYGPGGKTYTRLPVQLARDGRFAWIDGGRGRANYNYIGNLLDAVLLAAQNRSAHGQRFIINDGDTTWREFLGPILEGFEIADVPAESWRALHDGVDRPARWRDVLHAMGRSPELVAVVNRHPVLKQLKRMIFRKSPRLKRELLEAQRESPADPDRPLAPDWLWDLMGPFQARFSARKAQEVLGWSPRIGLREGQRLTVEWLKRQRIL